MHTPRNDDAAPHARLTGWGGTSPSVAQLWRAHDAEEVGRALAAPGGRGVIARGLGRAYGDAAQNGGGLVIDGTALDAIGAVDTERATITVGGGASLGVVLREVLRAGWCLPVLPGTRHVTVGGAIAADVHGKNHHRQGAFGRHVEALTLVTPDGASRVVTRDSDAPLFDATTGGMGLTGLITSATLRLFPVETRYVRVQHRRTPDLDATMLALMEADGRHAYSVAWLDLTRRDRRGVVSVADHLRLGDTPPDLRATAREAPTNRARRTLTVPPLVPVNLVTRPAVRLFNEAWFRRTSPTATVVPFEDYVAPLDALGAWPRLYGRRGLLQYQCVVPDGQERVLAALVEAFTRGPATPALAVLKRLGPQGKGMLSFPMQGWTLAVDLPAHDAEVYLVLDRMDQVVAEAGGRVYLAKDARLRPDVVGAMYPRLAEWRDVKARVDPEVRFRSDLAERIGLVAARSRATTGG